MNNLIRQRTMVSDAAIAAVLGALADIAAEQVAHGKVAVIPGIGYIEAVERGGYKRNDPGRAGCTIDVPIHRKVKIMPSECFLRSLSALDKSITYRK